MFGVQENIPKIHCFENFLRTNMESCLRCLATFEKFVYFQSTGLRNLLTVISNFSAENGVRRKPQAAQKIFASEI